MFAQQDQSVRNQHQDVYQSVEEGRIMYSNIDSLALKDGCYNWFY